MKRVLTVLCTLAVAAAFTGSPVLAHDEPTEGMPGKLLLVKGGKLAKFISKPVTGDTFDLPALNDPTVEGATISFRELGTNSEISASLPAAGWKGLGNPAGSKGFKYKGAGTPTDPCKTVLVKTKIVKAICKGTAIDLDQPVDNVVAISLIIGTDSKAYCTAFGGTEIKNDSVLLKRKDSAAGACTCGNGSPSRFTFKNGPPTTPNCGVMTTNTGATTNLACNGLYIGSGSASLVQPETNPDSEKALQMDIACCTGETLVLEPTTQTDTGDIETCTSAGCFFGAPLPLPNPSNPPVSTCVYNRYLQDVKGEADCATGSARLNAPLASKTFLTGDLLLNRCVGGTNPGARCGVSGTVCLGGGSCQPDSGPTLIQSCPICNPVTLRCNGGANGMGSTGAVDTDTPCTPDGGLNVAGAQFPTSHDCTVSTVVLVGDLPVPFLLTTGTSTDTATATGTLQRSFCGHCRNSGTGAFGICTAGTNNGMACTITNDCGVGGVCEAKPCEADADCAGDPVGRTSCEQRNNGAFGPGGGANMTITEVGTPAGDLGDQNAHPGTMVSVFCIPPSFNPIIDPNADIPGPGAVSLPGTFDINSPSGAFVDGGSLF